MVSRKIEKISSKSGLPVLQVEHEGKMILIHSKYDPVKEAEQMIDRYKKQMADFHHILFYGVGLGYHVKAFLEQYPEKLASTYEPIIEVASACTASLDETKLDVSKLTHTFVEEGADDLEQNLYTLSNHLTQKLLVIVLPAYERILKEDTLRFLEKFKEIVDEKKTTIGTNMVFSKRWTVNSLMNLPSTFEHPNFLLEHAETFQNKPVLLVAAGPSLSEEMENLRLIKEKGLAYIFAVGSANKALIAQGIHPDAVFTYDPQAHNYTVFQPIIDERIRTIPIVYGTSVGFETIQRYPGPKFHFVTSQDTITQLFHKTDLPVINDAYSIAIVTLQLLFHVQVKKIILVGQNFAFKKDLFYAQEINRYDKETKKLSDASVQKSDLEDSFYVQDVYGNDILTNKGFNNMRLLMEKYLRANPQIPVVNTTLGGAAIEGTKFVPLVQLIEEELKGRVVMEGWYEKGSVLPMSAQATKRLKALQKDTVAFIKQYEAIFNFVQSVEYSFDRLKEHQIQKRLETFDDLTRKLTANKLYENVIRPITRNYFEKLQTEVAVIRKQQATKEKLVAVVNLFVPYFHICLNVYKEVAPIIQTVVLPAHLKETDKKELVATSGVFQYEGEWEKQPQLIEQMPVGLTEEEKEKWHDRERKEDRIELPISSVRTTGKNASFTFQISGTSLFLYGTNHAKGILKLRVIIDNKITNVIIKDSVDEKLYGSFMRQQLFQTTNLKKGLHDVTVEVLSDHPDFLFQGIEVDKNGRAYHIHEVTTVDELEIGKRIRCHYEATYNTVGKFSELGEERGAFLPVDASAEPIGDFYFIMVDEINGEKKLIADRNVQNYISWVTLNQFGFSLNKGVVIESLSNKSYQSKMNLLYGGESAHDITNEWNQYIIHNNLAGKIVPGSDLTWNWAVTTGSWTNANINDKNPKGIKMVPLRGKKRIEYGVFVDDLVAWLPSTISHIIKVCGFRPVITLKKY
ncbi:hypothetical protein HNO89_000855 [Sporosarcina luteola]|nr:hypothetical protein [Sporosarcina luteola]